MSNESSASETTPLRRPESQNSDNISIETPSRSVVSPLLNHNAISATNTTVAIANHNNNIEVRLNYNNNNNLNNNISNSNDSSNSNNSPLKMDTNKRILYRVGLDVLILLCVGAPILAFHLWGNSYKRGFFCDDESLKHPFHESTVKSWMLYIIGLVLPIGVMLTVEIIKSKQQAKNSNGNATGRRYVFMDYEIPDWLLECYKKVGIFGFGAAVSQLTTDIAKYSIGRLRPHFFAVCQPVMLDGTTCADAANTGKYIQEFTCRGLGSTERMLKEVRLSFPSGHSSFTFYTMVYVALYLQSRMTWRGSKLFRHFLQFLFIMIAWYTALSRISDYKHHWSDVLAGASIGSLCAIVVANYISDLFQRNTSTKSYALPRTTQDMSSHTTLPTN